MQQRMNFLEDKIMLQSQLIDRIMECKLNGNKAELKRIRQHWLGNSAKKVPREEEKVPLHVERNQVSSKLAELGPKSVLSNPFS